MKARERVAALRRQLPPGAPLEDYEFIEGPASLDDGDAPAKVRLSELFSYAPHPDPLPTGEGANRSLIIYHFMFGKKQTTPCPMCTAWIDCCNGIAHHLAQNVDLVIVAARPPSSVARFPLATNSVGFPKCQGKSAIHI